MEGKTLIKKLLQTGLRETEIGATVGATETSVRRWAKGRPMHPLFRKNLEALLKKMTDKNHEVTE